MSYNSVLDYYFSSLALGVGLPFALMIAWASLRMSRKIWKKRKYSFGESVINMGIAFILVINWGLLNPMYYGYGNANGIDDIRYENGHLVVLDYTMSMASRYESGDAYNRIHELDPKSGDRILRFRVGPYASYAGLHGDSVCVSRSDDAEVFSLSKGKSYAIYSKENLPKLFPEISAGIDNFGWGEGHTIMELDVMDGSKWDLYLKNGLLKRAYEDGHHDEMKPVGYFINEREVNYYSYDGLHTLFSIDSKGDNDNLRYFKFSDDSIPAPELSFIHGKPVILDTMDNSCVVLSYETLEHRKFIITSVGLDGKTKHWDIHSSTLDDKYELPDETEPHFAMNAAKGLLYFNVGSTVYAVKLSEGNVVWKTML